LIAKNKQSIIIKLTKIMSDQNQGQNSNNLVQAAQVDLIKELGIDQLPKEEQEKMLLEINEVIQQRILIRVAEELEDAKVEEMEKLLADESTTPEQVQEFLTANVENFEQKVLEEIGGYKQELLDFMSQATQEGAKEE